MACAIQLSLLVMSALTEGQCLGPYRIVRLLGEGGMGAVYEARQQPLDRRVALKTLHPEYARNQDAIARFFNEAKALSRVEHPSIVQVSDFGNAADGTAYLVMEYLRGQSLGRRLADGDGRVPVVTALQLAWQVADVLAVAHAQGVVHRDLKPENLMLVADPIAPGGERVKILDFGIAKLTKASDRGSVKTDTQAVMGTPMYMSPEQCAGAGGVDAKTDVYALGCVLYHMLAGRPPFVAEGPGQLIGMHLFQQPPALASHAPNVSASVIEFVHRLLTKDKAHRPTMSETADALERLLGKLSNSGSVMRSRLPTSTDPDATRAFLFTSPSTTLGQLTGQRSQLVTKRSRLVAAGATIVLVAAAGVAAAFYGFAGYAVQHEPGSRATPTTAAARPPDTTTQSVPMPLPIPRAPAEVSMPPEVPVPPFPLRRPPALATSPLPPALPTPAIAAPPRPRIAPAPPLKSAAPASSRPLPAITHPANRPKLNPYDL